MKLSVIDRIIITKSLLPATGTIEQIKTILSLKTKIGFSKEELDTFLIDEPYKGILEINNITTEMANRTDEFGITIQELDLLKIFAESLNVNGWVTESSLDTVEYILKYTIE